MLSVKLLRDFGSVYVVIREYIVSLSEHQDIVRNAAYWRRNYRSIQPVEQTYWRYIGDFPVPEELDDVYNGSLRVEVEGKLYEVMS